MSASGILRLRLWLAVREMSSLRPSFECRSVGRMNHDHERDRGFCRAGVSLCQQEKMNVV